MASHIIVKDPYDIANQFGNRVEDEETEFDSVEVAGFGFAHIEKYLSRIPPREADLIEKYYCLRLKQEQIAKLFGVTQAAVSYRLHRAIKRIQFLRTIPELDKKRFDRDLAPLSAQDQRILWLMYETTCQSAVAKTLGLTQGRVRHRFFALLKQIKQLSDFEPKKFGDYYAVFQAISQHFCILKEVSLPQFANRGDAEIRVIE